MSDDSATGWRLSQEQLGFLEELLSEAILEKAEAGLRESVQGIQEELKESLLEEFVSLHDAGSGDGATVDEEALLARLEERLSGVDEEALLERLRSQMGPVDEDDVIARLQERVEKADEEALLGRMDARIQERLAEHVGALQASGGTSGQPSADLQLPPDLVVADDLRALEAWVREQLDQQGGGAQAAPADHAAAAASVGAPPRWRIGALSLVLLVSVVVGGWVTVAARLDAALEARSELLAGLGTRTESVAEQVRSRADASEALFKDINAAAAEIRQTANSQAVRTGLVEDLTADPSFIAATTGPAGPRGPVGMPERVGLAPGRFSFQNTSGATVAVMGQDETGRGHAQIYGQSGASVAYLGTDNGTEGSVRVRDTSGSAEVSVKAGRQSSTVAISTNQGQEAFLRTRNGQSAEMGVTNRSGDGGVVLRSQGGFGAIQINGMMVHDFAEVFELVSRAGVAPGTVMSIAGPSGRLGPSTWAYDPSVIGVVSGAGGLRPGLTIGTREDGSNDLPVAMSGQVFVRVNGEGGPIQVGDLLVASTTRGVAMRGGDVTRLPGAVIGKAMGTVSQFPNGEALIRMFVMAR